MYIQFSSDVELRVAVEWKQKLTDKNDTSCKAKLQMRRILMEGKDLKNLSS